MSTIRDAAQFYVLFGSEKKPIVLSRPRAAFLLRAARSRRGGNVQRLRAHKYLLRDSNALVYLYAK